MEKNYRALELDKILKMLAEEATCEDAAEMALSLSPVHTKEQAEMLLGETDAAFVMMAKFGAPSFYGIKNVTNPLRRAQAGGGLNMTELLGVGGTLRAIRSLIQWRSKGESIKNALTGRFEVLMPNKYLEEKIFQIILSEEEMADNASPVLADIRRKLVNASNKVRDQLNKIVHSQSRQKYLQDTIITMRSGRYVVPVKAEFRNEVPGLIHDSSSSGATVFVEPMSVVEANNEIRILKSREEDEIQRILLELSSEAGDCADTIIESYGYAIELNVIFAKAHLAYKMKAVVPIVNENGKVNLKAARHPLIDKNKVVSTDITLGISFDTLIITGPNTGGKTVSLKTLGLLTLMAMCGLMIPAADESEISVFDNILVDIGDEQSIEQSLSTFSSHMTNIIKILETANSKSLVLLDELGAGTDPVEGAALATAIIEQIRAKFAKLACTTHYAELKAYAINTAGVENGCCEFDVATLRPTYRLLVGVPGKSNAFAISKRLGMSDEIVERARELVSTEDSRFEEVVDKLEASRRVMENEIEQARHHRADAEKKAQIAAEAENKAKEKANREIESAKKQAAEIVFKTRLRADALMNEIEEIRRQKNKELTAEQKAKLRFGMRDLEGLSDPVNERKNEDYVLPRALKSGDNVLIFDIDKSAIVLEEANGNTVLVQAGIIKTRVGIDNLRLLNSKSPPKKQQGKKERTVTTSEITGELMTDLDLRGKNTEEALMDVDSFLDHATMRALQKVTIIHGKGTGVLRTAIQQHLRRCPQVKSFRLGTYGEGETGVTIVELK